MSGLLALLPAFLTEQAPPLLIVLPLAGGALAAMLPWPRVAWGLTLAITLATAALCVLALAQVMGGLTSWSYALGSWPPPLGIEYRIDALNAPMLALVAAVALLCAIYAPSTIAAEVYAENRPAFYGAFLLCLCGLLGVVITADAFNMFVFLEISSLSSYALVAMGARRDRRALTAAFNYLIAGTVGATFFVIGVGFLYMATGTLNMAGIASQLPALENDRTIQAGFAFIVVGLGLKLAMFPLHGWLPNAYAFAPTMVTAFFAATSTKVAFYALIRFMFGVFGTDLEFIGVSLFALIAPLAAAGMIGASFAAAYQRDVRRLFAWSSVAQVGYMLLGAGIATVSGLAAGALHLFNHALMKGAIFFALGALWAAGAATRVSDLRGLGRTMPMTAAALTIGGLSLIGVPGTAGFVSKWALLTAALERGWWWAVAVIAAGSVLAFIYVGRVLEAMYVQPAAADAAPVRPPVWALVPMWIMTGATVLFGVWAELPARLALAAARAAMGIAP